MSDNKQPDAIPEQFDSYEEAAEFWGAHDTTEYPEAFGDVTNVVAERRGRYYEIEIDADVAQALAERARKQGLPISLLASDMLRRQLSEQE